MDGRRRLQRIGCTLALLGSTALLSWSCSSMKSEPLPFPLYDSPLIAGGVAQAGTPRSDFDPMGKKNKPSADESDQRMAEADAAKAPEPAPEPTSKPSEPAPPPVRESESDSPDDAPSPPALSSNRSTPSDNADQTEETSKTGKKAPPSDGSAAAKAAGYVAAIYELNDVELSQEAHRDIPALYRRCRKAEATFQTKAPAAGDLVFFHNVRDANADGRNNDWYTHVGLVEKVGRSGTVHVLSYRNGSVGSMKLNLETPDASRDQNGRTINTKLRPETDDEPPFTQHLAGQLFAGYCSLLGDRSELLVVDNWQPGMELQK